MVQCDICHKNKYDKEIANHSADNYTQDPHKTLSFKSLYCGSQKENCDVVSYNIKEHVGLPDIGFRLVCLNCYQKYHFECESCQKVVCYYCIHKVSIKNSNIIIYCCRDCSLNATDIRHDFVIV